jgi:concanavalin A-like lectin/glucanase superfamily protein/PA14 domain-containing protein/glycosyl hydrolase family 2
MLLRRIRFGPLTLLLIAALVILGLPLTGTTVHAVPAAAATHGLKGEYFSTSGPDAHDFAKLGGTLLDPNVDFSDLVPTFQSLTGQGEHTTARWTGQLAVPTTGDYTFSAIGDNGFRLFIDDKPVIDHWVGDWDREQVAAPISLQAGVQYSFRMELFQDVGGANLFLRWSGPGIAKQIVPMSAFTTPPGFEVYPVDLTVAPDGRKIQADFDGAVTKLGAASSHLQVLVDGTPFPVTSVAVKPGDDSVLVLTLGEAVFKDQLVRIAYDGTGGLVVAGDNVPTFNRVAMNGSTQRMTTPWAAKVDKNRPLPEYPRPQLVRKQWQNLNGPWQFSGATLGQQPTFGKALPETITVPYPVESQLSGIERHEDHMFYRKTIDVPKNWQIGHRNRLRLNFGAVDNEATVYVNGRKVAQHRGGYTAFTADITDALSKRGPQEILVDVTDTTNGDTQPIGKQSSNPGGIVYTASSGIWQTVWLEPVPEQSIDTVVTTPDIKNSRLQVTVNSSTAPAGALVVVHAKDKQGRDAGRVTGRVNTQLALPISRQHLWTPDDPYLYTLTTTLVDRGAHDTVTGYFGMRSIAIDKVGGYNKIVLNGKPVFTLAMLDQGFFPDGLYTAPTDEALAFDLHAQKNLGFNAVRKHIKVEPARWYYHADQIGLLVWQDFVSGGTSTDQGKQDFFDQGKAEMAELHNFPSVIGWVVFNEGWGEWDRTVTGQLADQVKALDPSRLVNAHSGVNCCNSKGDSGKGDIVDHHDYNNTDPATPDATRAAIDGEHGGFTLRTPGHMYPGPPLAIYSGVETKAALSKRYVDNTETFYLAAAREELSGSVYTQVTDLEHEINGMWTYDRRVLKVDAGQVRAINEKVVAAAAAAGTPIVYPGKACWSLDEGAGTTGKDSCGTSNVSTVGSPSWVGGVSGTALNFNGTDSYAETAGPVVDTTKDYSVSAWVKLAALPGNYATAVSEDGRATANPFYLQYGQGGFAFSLPGDVRAKASMTPTLGQWYHLVGVRNQATDESKLYIDGKLAATTTGGVDGIATGPLAIGRAKFAGQKGDFWNGSIDQVKIFDQALTDTEISTLYTAH